MKIIYYSYILILMLLASHIKAQQTKDTSGIKWAKRELQEALTDTTNKQILTHKVIPDKETAIAVAEPILFKGYGKENIIRERPYDVYYINGYWILNGTLPKAEVGGTFEMIIRATDGKVIKVIHGK